MKTILFSFILFLLPGISNAQVIITEIMYDAEGSDTGQEWIEVYNESDQSIPFSSWYFYEQEVHHRLSIEGSDSLEPNTYAIITTDPEGFTSVFGSLHQVFKSSFSLNNTGESLAISDENKEIIFDVTYESDMGAAGDGNTLQYDGSGYVPRSPSPSEGISSQIEVQEVQSSGATKKKKGSQTKSEPFTPYYEVYMNYPQNISSGNNIYVEGGVYYVTRNKRVRKKKGVFILNMGDGMNIVSDERLDFTHRYENPGVYTLVFRYYTSVLAYEKNNEPTLMHTETIEVYRNDIEIETGEYGSLVIRNNSTYDVDISNWFLKHLLGEFVFPEFSYIKAKNQISVPFEVLGNYVSKEDMEYITLFNEQGRVQAEAFVGQRITEEVFVSQELIDKQREIMVQEEIIELPNKDIEEKSDTKSLVLGFSIFSVILFALRYISKQKEAS